MRFRALDGWRGIAAILGVLYHWPLYGHLYPNLVVRNAYLFVDFFFVLSGFVISFGYAERITTPRAAISFLIRRFARLWPLHAAMLAIFVMLEFVKTAVAGHGLHFRHEAFTGLHSFDSLFANIILVHSLGLYDHLTWNAPSWSDSAQFWGYVTFAVVILLWPRRSVAISVIGSIVAWLLIGTLSHRVPLNDVTYDFGLPRCLLGLCIGHLTYHFYTVGSERATNEQARLFQRKQWGFEIVVFLGLLGFICIAGTGYLTLASPAVFAVVVYTFARERGAISRLLQWRSIQTLGRWSYSIYITHLLVLTGALELCHFVEKVAGVTLLEDAFGAPSGTIALVVPLSRYAMDVATLAYVAAVIGFGAMMHRLVEVPCRDWFSRNAGSFSRYRSIDEATRGDIMSVVAQRLQG